MKHQITLLGGQLTPVYWGIIERDPDIIHLLYTIESRFHVPILEGLFARKEIHSKQISPYNFDEIKVIVESIIFENPDDTYELNLTGGTKLMALACQNIFVTLGYNSFYIDQNNRIFDFITQEYTPIKTKVNTGLFFKLSGHENCKSKTLSDYSTSDMIFAKQIELISESKDLKKILQTLKFNKVDPGKVPGYAMEDKSIKLNWKSPYFNLQTSDLQIKFESKNAFNIAFNGLWWELIVADALRKWTKIFELRMGLEVFSKTEQGAIKNEIDILINTGFNLIFIECKSGDVIQEDINKIRVVKRLYGGLASRSILICKYSPRKSVIEKCKDLGIDVFDVPNTNGLIPKLELLLKKYEL
jgi:hypothetical protein